MKFPESERVIYEKNPLVDVICQLQFPPILRISQQPPVDFQDRIREEYPIFEFSQGNQLPPEISNIMQQLGSSLISNQTYIFKSEDSIWQIVLNQNSITLSTRKYERYEIFKKKFQDVIYIFEEIYKPSFYSRVGLRYRDLILPSKLNVQNFNWSELIPNHIASELHSPEMASSITAFMKNLQMSSDDKQIAFNHGLVTARDGKTQKEEEAYLLDADFSTTTKVSRNDNVWDTIDMFNKMARNLFRWSITDKLHNILNPSHIDNHE
ncbi:MAG: TIGR04255 family protein [Xenococcus sp. MO_188.B8]|nr:TIGR04255 family protein [Xenococcus sp. MO_188.B8]